jgi:hypothetical protein
MAAATPILIFHKVEPCSWSLTPGPWFLQRRRRLRIPSAEPWPAGPPWDRSRGSNLGG